jgi:hypothetical protein
MQQSSIVPFRNHTKPTIDDKCKTSNVEGQTTYKQITTDFTKGRGYFMIKLFCNAM